ncbi:MAPEG family protein [Myxococcota bacterium]|nr:MAPEG family protein [Myxococcota bacterium]
MTQALATTIAAHAVLGFVLGMRVIVLRWTRKVGLGDGQDKDLRRAIRVHGNFAEWVPLALLALVAAEARGADPRWIWALGGTLLLGRVGHAVGLSGGIGPSVGRSGGMVLTFSVLLVAAGLAVMGG